MTISISSPPVVAASSLVAFGSTAFVEKFVNDGNLSLASIKMINLGLYALSYYAATQPGRIDGREKAENANDSDSPEIQDYTRRNSLVTPSGWAFAIWPLIFAGELIFVASSALLVKEESSILPLYRAVSGGFMMAQIFQSLWTQAFRPQFKGKLIYISSLLLSGIAYSLSRAHRHFSAASLMLKNYQYILYFFPMTLHFGWVTAASLVNWNGNLAMPKNVSPTVVAVAGHLSALLATGLGVSLTVTRHAPVFGCVIAWALAACSTGLNDRLGSVEEKDGESKVVGIYGARVQKWLCGLGAALSVAASIYTVVAPQE